MLVDIERPAYEVPVVVVESGQLAVSGEEGVPGVGALDGRFPDGVPFFVQRPGDGPVAAERADVVAGRESPGGPGVADESPGLVPRVMTKISTRDDPRVIDRVRINRGRGDARVQELEL